MTLLEKFVENAREAEVRGRKLLVGTIIYCVVVTPIAGWINRGVGKTPFNNLIAFVLIMLIFLVPLRFAARWALRPVMLIRCPKCRTYLGQWYSFRNKFQLKKLVANPGEYSKCRECGIDFSSVMWNDETE